MTPTLPFACASIAVASIALALVFGRSAPVVVAAEPVADFANFANFANFAETWKEAALPLLLQPRITLSAAPANPVDRESGAEVSAEPRPNQVLSDASGGRHRIARKLKTKKYIARDVCQRHGMKKVKVGKYRWTCRR